MFGITYNVWKQICDKYGSLREGKKKAFLQWFPLSKLFVADAKNLKSEYFFNRYIKSGAFVLFPDVMQHTDNYMQKSDGSFRESSLVSPIMYLILQSIGKEISLKYKQIRPNDISVYYAGNYEAMRITYNHDYDDFFNTINRNRENYNYFIKTDIVNFFPNISLDILFSEIDSICNEVTITIPQTQITLYKELLAYLGNGKFPLIENSIMSSYLSTIIYLDKVDTKLFNFLQKYMQQTHPFKMIRYVDDLYILINFNDDINVLQCIYNEIKNEYSSILKKYNLILNTKKSCIEPIEKINEELKKSLYDEQFRGKKHHLPSLYSPKLLLNFLQDISDKMLGSSISTETYMELIDTHFSVPGIEFTPEEVFNIFIYEKPLIFRNSEVIQKIVDILQKDIAFISLDPKRLTIMVTNTHNSTAITAFLNQLFIRSREGKWNSYDTVIAITYLIQRNFLHQDLLKIIEEKEEKLYHYYKTCCETHDIYTFNNNHINRIGDIIEKSSDTIIYYLYFMYIVELGKNNNLSAYAYFKNYFDRITADMAFIFGGEKKKNKPSYESYYKDKSFFKFYKSDFAESVITKAHELRNQNPLCHSSAKILDNNNSTQEIKQCILDLSKVIDEYLDNQETISDN